MGEVVEAVGKLAAIMSEITSASQEQSSGLDQIAQAVAQLDDITQQNAGLVHAAVSATEALEGQARSLAESLGSFKVDGGISGQLAQAEAIEVIAKVRAAALVEVRKPHVAQLARMDPSVR
jgi:predicted HAD superfamily Cof-like phosphohydrolase